MGSLNSTWIKHLTPLPYAYHPPSPSPSAFDASLVLLGTMSESLGAESLFHGTAGNHFHAISADNKA